MLVSAKIIQASTKYQFGLAAAPAVFMYLSGRLKDAINPLALEKFDAESCQEKMTIPSGDQASCVVFADPIGKRSPESVITINLLEVKPLAASQPARH